ncbi:MAG: hypothetical protein GY859_40150, partial [Desulfobacterales bacterium]|nr:hypothetical protein [Desulfobacterales bacterium]
MPVAGHSFPRRENDLAAWWPMVAASMLGHVVIFVCLILAPLSSPETYAP